MRIVPLVRGAGRLARTAKEKARSLTSVQSKLKFYYAWYCKHCDVDDKVVLLDSFNGKGVTDSAYAVLQEMMDQGIANDYDIYFASKNPKKDQSFVTGNNLPVQLVDVNSKEYARVLATAGHILTNAAFAAFFIRRPGQICVDVWHGTPLKTLGKQMRLGMQSMFFAQHTFMQSSWLTYPNEFTRDVMMRDYNIDELYTGKVAMVGYPRNSVFMRGADAAIRERYELDKYTTFAYMPTWRGKSTQDVDTTGYVARVKEILAVIDCGLKDDQRMFVNFHPMVASSIVLDSYEHIVPFPADLGTYDFLAQLDVLVTDYSSVLFDFALTRKPVVLFTYDMEDYLSDRGLYFPITDLPFPQFNTVEELVDSFVRGTYTLSDEQLKQFEDDFLKYDSANNARDVVNLLLHDDPGSLEVIDYASNKSKTWTVVNSQPQKTLADINGIFLSSKRDKEVILLDRLGFGPGKSRHVVENYTDDYKFLFVSPDTPRTYAEEAVRHIVPSVKRKYEQRERRRMFGDLPTAAKPRVTRVSGEANTTYSPELSTSLPGGCATDGDTFVVTFDRREYQASKLLLVTENTVRWSRTLTEEELAEGKARLNPLMPLVSPLFKANIGTRARVCLLVEEAATGKTLIADLVGGEGAKREKGTRALTSPLPIAWEKINPLITFDEKGKTGIALIDKSHGSELGAVTILDNGVVTLVLSIKEYLAQAFLMPMVTSVRTPNQRVIELSIRVEAGDYTIAAVELRNRIASSSTSHQFDFEVVPQGDTLRINASMEAQGNVYDGLFWDVFVVVSMSDGMLYDLACYTSDAFRHSLFFRNLQCVLPDGNVIFPYATAATKLAFTHRTLHPSDTLLTRFKEWGAVGAYGLLLPWWYHRRIWLVYEKFCAHAQDNGYAFFEWCMHEAPEAMRKHVFYVIDRDAPEYEKVRQYDRNVVQFMSFRHMLYALAARIYVSPDSVTHLYAWRSKPSVVRRLMGRKPILFLQHGVTALKRVDHLFGVRGSTPMTYFLTTSHAEQDVVTENLGYKVHNAPVLGFSRWDLLNDASNAEQPTILLMPTWRVWLEDVGDEAFLASEYYNAYSAFIQDPRIHALLERANATLEFCIHPKLADQLRHFSGASERVKLIPMGEEPINQLLMKCRALITDYSSVAWDVLYQDKPVVFYQFDQQQYLDEVGSYVDLNNDLPGPVCKDLDTLVQALEALVENHIELSPQNRAIAQRWFDFKDQNNRKRTYDFLVDEGF